MKPRLLLGWDIGGTKSTALLGTCEGKVLAREQWPTAETAGPSAMLLRFEAALERILKSDTSISALGVSMPGPMNMRTGMVLSPPHLIGWERVPLRDLLAALLARRGFAAPVVVLHDAAACMLAEARWGAAVGVSQAIYLTCGTGFGSGVLLDNRILIGPGGESPEVGFVNVADDGPSMQFGGRTRVAAAEVYGCGWGIERLAAYRFPKLPGSKQFGFSESVSCTEIADFARQGQPQACNVLKESALRVAQVCVNLAAIFAPQKILIGSLARYLPAFWLEEIKTYFADNHLPSNSANTQIEPAMLGERLQDLSALAAAEYRL